MRGTGAWGGGHATVKEWQLKLTAAEATQHEEVLEAHPKKTKRPAMATSLERQGGRRAYPKTRGYTHKKYNLHENAKMN